MKIEILGTGCMKCTKLYDATKEAVQKAGIAADVTKVQDLAEMMKYGVITTPALVIDGQVKLAGKTPSADEIAKLLK